VKLLDDMKFLDLVKQRRSCRKYIEKPLPQESINRCLEAARLAPSACNSQPWKFIVVENKELRSEIAQKAFSGIYKMNAFACNAQALVFVVREKSKPAAQVGQMIQGTQFNLIDLGIACQHFILQAQEDGLGSCWIGWFNSRAVKKILNIKKSNKVEIIISLGYPQKEEFVEKRRKPLGEMSTFYL